MAGIGVAIRLHEFRGTLDSNDARHLAKKVVRQGTDVRGLYPGQIGRVHTTPAPAHRVRYASLVKPYEADLNDSEGLHPPRRSFDLLACQSVAHHCSMKAPSTSSAHKSSSFSTTYQDHYGTWAGLFVDAERKYTLNSHPQPIQADEDLRTTVAPSQIPYQM